MPSRPTGICGFLPYPCGLMSSWAFVLWAFVRIPGWRAPVPSVLQEIQPVDSGCSYIRKSQLMYVGHIARTRNLWWVERSKY